MSNTTVIAMPAAFWAKFFDCINCKSKDRAFDFTSGECNSAHGSFYFSITDDQAGLGWVFHGSENAIRALRAKIPLITDQVKELAYTASARVALDASDKEKLDHAKSVSEAREKILKLELEQRHAEYELARLTSGFRGRVDFGPYLAGNYIECNPVEIEDFTLHAPKVGESLSPVEAPEMPRKSVTKKKTETVVAVSDEPAVVDPVNEDPSIADDQVPQAEIIDEEVPVPAVDDAMKSSVAEKLGASLEEVEALSDAEIVSLAEGVADQVPAPVSDES